MIKVGITGNIGSGKTTVCRIFEVLGIPVYYADTRAKALMHVAPLKERIIQVFGQKSFADDKLNRKYLAEIVFGDKEKLDQLNGLVHPVVARDAELWFSQQKNKRYALKEAALLFESGSSKGLDAVICVAAPESMRINRVMMRDTVKREDVRARIRNQMPQQQKMEMSDFIINNDGSESLVFRVLEIHRALLNRS